MRQGLHGRRLDEATRAVADLGGHSHVVGVDPRKTFFLPAIGGRLSLHQDEEGTLEVDLAYDETAQRRLTEILERGALPITRQ